MSSKRSPTRESSTETVSASSRGCHSRSTCTLLLSREASSRLTLAPVSFESLASMAAFPVSVGSELTDPPSQQRVRDERRQAGLFKGGFLVSHAETPAPPAPGAVDSRQSGGRQENRMRCRAQWRAAATSPTLEYCHPTANRIHPPRPPRPERGSHTVLVWAAPIARAAAPRCPALW